MTEGPHEPADGTSALERIRRLFRFFAATQCRGRSLVYETLAEGVARDEGLLQLLLAAPDEQRRPSLLFAAVNSLLRSRPDAELARYYPIHGGQRTIDDRLVPTFTAFCDHHRDELVRLLREKSTQTNEIRRCIALRLGLDHVHRRWPGPLALVEMGASAGLNLLFDRYHYRLDGDQTAASPVVISCDVRDDSSGIPVLAPAPTITSRLGVDQDPIHLSDPDARAWLEAFIWPEQVEDLATLRSAIDLALSTPIATLTRGDATTDTTRILTELPGGKPVVVFTASLLSYLTADARAAFVAQLRDAAGSRPVAWVFAESPALLATTALGVAALDGPLAQRNSLYLIGTTLFGPDHDNRLLALADPYLRWLAPARHPTDDFQWFPDDGR